MIIMPHRMSRRELLGAGFAVSAAALSPAVAKAGATMNRIMDAGKVAVGIANEKPYGYVETDGRLVGAIPDIILAATSRPSVST